MQENKQEKKANTQISLPSSESGITKESQRPEKDLLQTKLELKETLQKKRTIQKKLASFNANAIKTIYDSRINKFSNQRDKLLLKYTDSHPNVRSVKKLIKKLKNKRLAKINSIRKSSKTAFNKESERHTLKKTLKTLNHKAGTLSKSILENQKKYNDDYERKYSSAGKVRKFVHPGGLHSDLQIEISRKKIAIQEQPWAAAFTALMQKVKKGLKKRPKAIKNFNVPAYYKNPKGHRKAQKPLSIDAWVAYSSAVAYQLTPGEERIQYAEKATQILEAWAKTNKRTSGADGDLSMVYSGVGLIFAAELLTDYDGWKKSQRKDFKKWLSVVYLKSCKKISRKLNNWGAWGILGCTATHYFLNDVNALDTDIKNIRKMIDNTILFDGSMPYESKRGSNGLWYTYFALAPLTSASQIVLNARNIDLFQYKSMNGAGIEEALDYLFRYSINPEKWPDYKGKDLNIPKPERWPGNLIEAMSGIYGKNEYKNWVANVRPIFLHGHHYAWTFPTLLRTISPHNNPHK